VRLLLTRPAPDAERTAASLRARGHTAIVAPLLRIEPIRDAAIADAAIDDAAWAAILVTSANAASAIAEHAGLATLTALPVFAVGERSAQAMRMAGFGDVVSANGDMGDLISLVAGRLRPAKPLLYLAGADRAGDLAGDLAMHGFTVHTAVVYRAVAEETLPAAAAAAFAEGIDAVLHFSRRTAIAYVAAARRAGIRNVTLGEFALGNVALQSPVHFCLSAPVAEPLIAAGAGKIRVAAEPTEAALLALVLAP